MLIRCHGIGRRDSARLTVTFGIFLLVIHHRPKQKAFAPIRPVFITGYVGEKVIEPLLASGNVLMAHSHRRPAVMHNALKKTAS
jgi:hypothetical protein